MKFSTSGEHENVLNNCEFRKNGHTESDALFSGVK
jgi:hypothetical protein